MMQVKGVSRRVRIYKPGFTAETSPFRPPSTAGAIKATLGYATTIIMVSCVLCRA
jgi:hypothetical protein